MLAMRSLRRRLCSVLGTDPSPHDAGADLHRLWKKRRTRADRNGLSSRVAGEAETLLQVLELVGVDGGEAVSGTPRRSRHRAWGTGGEHPSSRPPGHPRD